MQRFENQIVERAQCPVQLGPKEWEYSFRFTQNVSLQDLEFVNCEFIGEGLTTYGAPLNRSTMRNVRLTNCAVNSFFGSGAIFDGILVDGLRTSRMPVILSACALRHVTLMGQCGRFLFNRNISHDPQQRNADFHAANAAFYANVDWAIDISKLKTAGLEFRGMIPARLIRRNPEVHFVMTRAVAPSGDWKIHEPFDAFDIAISQFVDSQAEDEVFVAEHRSKHFKQQVEYFHRLKTAGLVI
jgi:hypothetical protein